MISYECVRHISLSLSLFYIRVGVCLLEQGLHRKEAALNRDEGKEEQRISFTFVASLLSLIPETAVVQLQRDLI